MPKKKAPEPCEFCAEDQLISLEGSNGHQLAVEFYPMNLMLAITSFGDNGNGEPDELQHVIEANYCPVCGRKLDW